MNFIPYKVNEVLDNVFYQIPKELLVNPIYNNLDSNSIFYTVYYLIDYLYL